MVISQCPICGGSIVVEEIHSYIVDYGVNYKTGKLLRSTRRRKAGELDVKYRAHCTNEKCDAEWSENDFFLNPSGHFVDKKYAHDWC